MPFNGSGTFQSLSPPQYPAVAGDTIRAAHYNAVINDIIAGLTNCVAKDGQSLPSANLPMNGKKHTGVADATADDEYATLGQLGYDDSLAPITVRADPAIPNTLAHAACVKFGMAAGSESGWNANPAAGDHVTEYVYANSDNGRDRIWASNLNVDVVAGEDATAWGMEINLNNAETEVQDPDALLKKVGLDLVAGAGSKTTAASRISGGSTSGSGWWYQGHYISRVKNNGILFRKIGGDTDTAFTVAAVSDESDSTVSFKAGAGSHSYALDAQGGTFAAATIRCPNNSSVVWRNAANNADVVGIYVNAGDNVVLGTTSSNIIATAHTIPSVDNTHTCGANGFRWSAVWAANGTIQTSDPTLKTDINTLPDCLPLVSAITPRTFRWRDGGAEMEEVVEVQTIQDFEESEVDEVRIEIRNGRPVQTTRRVKTKTLLFDELPVVDEAGATVMVDVTDNKGKVIGQAPKTHKVPRMVTKPVAVRRPVSKPGKRLHWGWLAPEVKAAFDAIGMDFGGYVKDEKGMQHLRPDQLIPVLWKAVQELSAEVAALKKAP